MSTKVKNIVLKDDHIDLGCFDSALVFSKDRGAFCLVIPESQTTLNPAALLLSSIFHRLGNDQTWVKNQLDYMSNLHAMAIPQDAIVSEEEKLYADKFEDVDRTKLN